MDSKELRDGYRCRELYNKRRVRDYANLDVETKEMKTYISKYGFEKIGVLKGFCDKVIRRRTKLRRIFKAYIELNRPIFFITLTFDNEILESRELKNLRRKARRFLFDRCDYYTFIEEYGEEKNRYHLHGLVVLKNDNWELIKEWSFRQNIKRIEIDKDSIKRVPKYLCKYLSKQDTRITMCKASIELFRDYNSLKDLIDLLDNI